MDNQLFHFRFSLRGSYHKGLQFLKPSFKHHPLNYVFAIVFFILAFVSTSAFAGTSFYLVSLTPSGTGAGETAELACSDIGGTKTALGKCNLPAGGDYNITQYSCDHPNAAYYTDRSGCYNVEPPPVDCPPAGTPYTLGFSVSSGSGITIGNKKSLDGCTVVPAWRTVDCYESPIGAADCKRIDGYTYTGETDPVGENASPPLVDTEDPEAEQPVDIPETEPLSDGKNLQPETTETIVQDTVTEIMPDGTTVQQDVTTTITTKGKGTDIETTTEEKKIVRDNGITKTETISTTTTTNPDGSKSIKTVTDVEYEQTDKELIIVKNADGSISIVKNEGYKGSSKTTNTKNYDSDGKKTSETESKEKEGDGDQSEGKYCEENPESMDCKKKSGAAEGGLYEPDEVKLEDVLKGFKTKLDDSDIGQALGGFYEVSVGGTCPRWAVDVWVFKFDLDQMCSSTMINALGLAAYVILATASFFAFRIAFL